MDKLFYKHRCKRCVYCARNTLNGKVYCRMRERPKVYRKAIVLCDFYEYNKNWFKK